MSQEYIPDDLDLNKYKNKDGDIRIFGSLKFLFELFLKPNGWGILPFFGTCTGLFFAWVFPRIIVAKLLAKMATNAPNINELYLLAFYLFISMLGGEALNRFVGWKSARVHTLKQEQLFLFAFKRLMQQSNNFFADNFLGTLVTKISNLVASYGYFFGMMLWAFSHIVIEILFAIFVLGVKAPIMLVFLAIILLIFQLFLKKPFQKKAVRNYEVNQHYTRLTGLLADDLSNYLAIKSFANEDDELEKVNEFSSHWRNEEIEFRRGLRSQVAIKISPITSILFSGGVFLSIYARYKLNVSPEIVFLSFTTFLGLATRVWTFKEMYEELENYLSKTAETLELLSQPVKINDAVGALQLKKVDGNIRFNNISFKYESNIPLFHNFNLEIEQGERIGLVGPSGGGKSTLTKLILRFEDTTSGEIFVDGQPIKEVTQQSLRRNISYIPQEPVLFHRTIKENICYGSETQVGEEQFKQVIKALQIDEFVKDLPEGYETFVGERGVKLSGGQKQRIAIARAMLKNSPIIILDEATSALDSHSEQIIQNALIKVMEGKTVIAIAHRLSTIAHLDRIIVLDSGKISEDGTHSELSIGNGLYRRLWDHQSGGYLGETY